MVRPSIARARALRKRANFPERKAWEGLRRLRQQGIAVRRQVPIAGLTVDFAIRSKRWVIEIDGSIHDLESVQIEDAARDARLRDAGWRVLRIPAEIPLSPDHLVKRVLDALD
ncbi:MAG: DUF559 domain-containing protein [Pseudomonadota bacterium]